MKACKHFSRRDGITYIVPSTSIWNGWVEAYDKHNNLIYSSFEVGLFSIYVYHLLNHPECTAEIGWSKEKIMKLKEKIEKEWVRIIEREWEEITKDC